MSTGIILLYAIGVFALMAVGLILTMIEFNRISEEPSQRKGAGSPGRMQDNKQVRNIREATSHRDAA